MNDKIVVAMSGGVDSCVAALLLQQTGHDLVGISMQVWDYRQNGGCSTRATCCAPDDFTDARMVAAKIGVPYYVFDFEQTFKEKVIDNFIEKYKQGLTPNPCIDCNNKVKFRELRERANTFGCKAVATGHYAQIRESTNGLQLIRGVDDQKDQSYFLYGLSPEELTSTIFPVGHLTKPEVRELARQAGLTIASKPESQDICFVSGAVKDFIVRIGGKSPDGNIVDSKGKVLGRHQGITSYTVGQRKGLGISSEDPLYVLEIRAVENQIIVGSKDELERPGFKVSELNFVNSKLAEQYRSNKFPIEFKSICQMRYRHEGVPVSVRITAEDLAEVLFLDEWSTVSPGQAAVFYDLANEEVLGGGRIKI